MERINALIKWDSSYGQISEVESSSFFLFADALIMNFIKKMFSFELHLLVWRLMKLHFLDALVVELKAWVDFEKQSSASMALLFISIQTSFLEFDNIFEPLHVPLDIFAEVNLSTQVFQKSISKLFEQFYYLNR